MVILNADINDVRLILYERAFGVQWLDMYLFTRSIRSHTLVYTCYLWQADLIFYHVNIQ